MNQRKTHADRRFAPIVYLSGKPDLMTKDKAIDILHNQQVSLILVNENNCEAWRSETASYVIKFFGKDSPQYEYISKVSFTSISSLSPTQSQINESILSYKAFLDKCITAIHNIGLYKTPKKNILSGLGDGIVIPILLASLGGMWWIGDFTGNQKAEIKNSDLKQNIRDLNKTIDSLGDTISSLRRATMKIPDKPADNKADTDGKKRPIH
jgi:hypothetical protein